jgi:hypothetical protein
MMWGLMLGLLWTLYVCGEFLLQYDYHPGSMRLILYSVTFFFEYEAEAAGSRTHADACGIDLANDGMCMLVS